MVCRTDTPHYVSVVTRVHGRTVVGIMGSLFSSGMACESTSVGNARGTRVDAGLQEIEAVYGSCSVELADALNNIGIDLYNRGELSSALAHYRRCLAIREVKAPGSLALARSQNNIGSVLWNQGDLSSALAHLRRCLAIQEVKAPGSLALARSLNNIGLVLEKQGDVSANLRLQRQSATIIDSVLGSRSYFCLLYTSPSPRDYAASRMPSSA